MCRSVWKLDLNFINENQLIEVVSGDRRQARIEKCGLAAELFAFGNSQGNTAHREKFRQITRTIPHFRYSKSHIQLQERPDVTRTGAPIVSL